MPSLAPGPEDRGRGIAAAGSALLAGFSLGMTGKLSELEPARAVIPPGTRVHVGSTGGQDLAGRVSTARAIKRSGFVPVPVIAARRLRSEAMLREYLDTLRATDASASVLVVAGEPAQPQGPYPDSASVIGSGLLERYGVRQVSVAGHPGGHPAADDMVLWSALAGKAAALEQRGLAGSVITQFGFDPALVLAWLADARTRGHGDTGRQPAGAGRRARPGERATAAVVRVPVRCQREYTGCPRLRFSLTGPAATAAPGRFIRSLASGYDPRVHGEMKLHFNPFGGFTATAEWASQFRRSAGTSGGAL